MDLVLTMGWDIVSIGEGVAQSAVAAGGRCCGNECQFLPSFTDHMW